MSYIITTLGNLVHQSAFFGLTWGNYLMVLVAFVFLYLAIKKGYEYLKNSCYHNADSNDFIKCKNKILEDKKTNGNI